MEAFGHVLSGVALAQLVRPAGPAGARFWPLWGGLVAIAPDVDAVSYLVGGPALFHEVHQYYTHSLLVSAVVTPLLARLAWGRAPAGTSYGRVLTLTLAAWGLHLLGDTIASWPVRIFWPFSRGGVAFDLIPRDFSIGVPLILLLGVGLTYVDELVPRRRLVALGALLVATAYVLVGPGW